MGGKIFLRSISADFKRALRFPLLIAILVVVLGFVFDNYGDLQVAIENPERAREVSTVLYFYFNSVSFGGVFSRYLFAMIAALPFASGYVAERQSGMTTFLISKTGQRNYCFSKMLVSAISGGLALAIGSTMFILIMSTRMPLVNDAIAFEHIWAPYHALLAGNGITYFAVALYLMFITGVLWGAVAMCVSAYVTDKYVVIASPFLIAFVEMQFSRMLKLPNSYRIEWLLTGRSGIGSDNMTLIVCSIFVLLVFAVCTMLFTRRVKGMVKNGFC
jgi:hypothetical protein